MVKVILRNQIHITTYLLKKVTWNFEILVFLWGLQLKSLPKPWNLIYVVSIFVWEKKNFLYAILKMWNFSTFVCDFNLGIIFSCFHWSFVNKGVLKGGSSVSGVLFQQDSAPTYKSKLIIDYIICCWQPDIS